jgi:DNA repair protein RAD50
MAMIEKLQIRGIRAFSPNCDETIEFYSPLTMIVGANGCGIINNKHFV